MKRLAAFLLALVWLTWLPGSAEASVVIFTGQVATTAAPPLGACTAAAGCFDLTNVKRAQIQVWSTLPAPTAPSLALVATGTGNVTAGTHMCEVTYVTAGGITAASPSSASVTADGTHKQITVTIPVSADAAVTGRNVYCTKAGGSTYFLVATSPVVGDNTAVTYTLNIADASFTATTAPTSSTITGSTATVLLLWRADAQSPWCTAGTISNPSSTQVGWIGPGGGQIAVRVSAYTGGTLNATIIAAGLRGEQVY